MFCQNCGTKIADEAARFCLNCGSKLATGQDPELTNDELAEHPLEDNDSLDSSNLPNFTTAEEQSRTSNRKLRGSALLWPIAVPVLSLMIAGSSGIAYYHHQVQTNKEVSFLKEEAEKDALKGKYTEALKSLKKAKALRPSYKVLKEDEDRIGKAIELENSLKEISESLKTQKFEKADSQISKFKELLETLKGPLFTPFTKQIDEKSTTLAVAKIKLEINNLNSVETLAGKLTALSSLQSAETDEVKRLILAKVVELTTKSAEQQLTEKEFTDALSTVEKGLEYASNDTKLLSFKDRIKNEQAAFEKAEQQRIEKAMEVAAQEDLNNHTAAVSVENLNVFTDDYGDLHISGDIINRATVPISSIKLFYTVYDLNGDSLGTDYMYVDPYYLEPGQNGSFDDYHYGVNQDTTVKITRITWNLN